MGFQIPAKIDGEFNAGEDNEQLKVGDSVTLLSEEGTALGQVGWFCETPRYPL